MSEPFFFGQRTADLGQRRNRRVTCSVLSSRPTPSRPTVRTPGRSRLMHAPTISIEDQTHARTSTDALSRVVLAGFAASLAMLLTFLVMYNVARLLSAT